MFDALSSRSALPITIYHSHSFPFPWIGTLSLPRRVLSKYICERKVIGFNESSIFLDAAHIYPYRSFVVFKQRATFFFLQLDYCAEKNQFLVNTLLKRKAQESINKVLAELLITTPSATDGSLPFNKAELCELHLPGDARSGSHHPRTISSSHSNPAPLLMFLSALSRTL